VFLREIDIRHVCRASPTGKRGASTAAKLVLPHFVEHFGDRLFRRRTGFLTLDHLLERSHVSMGELLMALARPVIPLHTSGSERDIRCQVIKR
jgi:hypothetical protein